jgi:hypothetical protein
MPRLSAGASLRFQPLCCLWNSQSERSDSVSVGAGVFTRLVRLVQTVLEFFLGLAQVLREFRKLRATEEHENENKENDALWATECKSDHELRLPHRGLDGVARPTRPRQVRAEQASWEAGWIGSGADDAARDLGALTADTPAFAFRQTAPDAELLTVLQCKLKAIVLHFAASANFFGFTGGRAALREEKIRVDAEAVRVIMPILLWLDWRSADCDT